MPPVYTGKLDPVIRHLDQLLCLTVKLHISLLTPASAAAFLEHSIR